MDNFRRIFIITILSMITLSNYAQNLVPNPSFEYYTSCPTASSQISLASPWQGVTTNSTDYFNICSSNVGIQSQSPKSGNAYAGLWVVNPFGYNYREYLRVKTDSILQTDSCYFVEFYCNLVNASRYGIKSLGAYLSSTALNMTGPGMVLQNTPQIVSDVFLNDTLNWMHVSGYYKANGGEQYITIGNFNTDSATDTIHTGGSYPGAYYFIDDVSITKIVGCDTLNPSLNVQEQKQDYRIKLYPNPGNGETTIQYHLAENDKAILTVYDITGKELNVQTLNSKAGKLLLDESELPAGIYYYTVTISNTAVKTEKLVIIK